MLTLIKEIFTWWNHQTFGTRLYTLFNGNLVGTDEMGNKYYQDKNNKRWVIYKDEIEATKIPQEWYSWMHHMNNKIENTRKLNKYNWQKEHSQNLTGIKKAYNPSKNKNASKKKYTTWNN